MHCYVLIADNNIAVLPGLAFCSLMSPVLVFARSLARSLARSRRRSQPHSECLEEALLGAPASGEAVFPNLKK